MEAKYRIRLKGKYHVVEKLENSKVVKSLTLRPDKVFNLLMCQDTNGSNVSTSDSKTKEKQGKVFAHELLTEPIKADINRTLWEMTK